MMNTCFLSIVCAVVLMAVTGCGRPSSSDVPGRVAAVSIDRLDMSLAAFADMDSVSRDSLRRHSGEAVDFLLVTIMGRESTDSALVAYARSRVVNVFEPDIKDHLPELDSVEDVLGRMAENLHSLSSDARMPHMYGIISPYNQRVFIADSIMLIGLNHYLGEDYKGYEGFPAYLRKLKHIGRLPYDVAEALIAGIYPERLSLTDATLLERMLYQGAVVAAIMAMVPDAEAKDVLAYSDEQWQWAVEHEAELWAALIGRQLLYSTSPTVAGRVIGESPSVSFLLPGTPGRIGRFIGWRIVQSYIDKNPDNSDVSRLLSPGFYTDMSALSKSGYSPR